MIETLRHHRHRFVQALILLLPTYLLRFSIGPLPLNGLDITIMVVFVLLFLTHDHKRELDPVWAVVMVALIGIGGLAAATSTDQLAASGLYKSLIILPIIAGISVWMAKPKLQHVIEAMAALSIAISGYAILQYFTGWGIPTPWNDQAIDYRVTSIFDFPNAVGLLLAPVTAMLMAYRIKVEPTKLTTVAVVMNISAIVMARADGGLVAVLAALVITLLFTNQRKLAIGMIVFGVLAGILIDPVREILLFQDTSGEVRLALWQGTWSLLQDNPLFGSGLAGFPELYGQYKLDRHVELLLYPHNILLNFWTQLGILGAIWLVFVLTRLARIFLQSRNAASIVLLAYVVAIVVYGLVDVPYFKNDLATLFWIVIGLSMTLNPVARKQ